MTAVTVWVIVSAMGLMLSVLLTTESWRDILALGDRGNGRRMVARSRFIREGLRITVHWAWLLLGLSVLMDVELGAKIVLGLLYGNAVLVVNSMVDARTRVVMYRTRDDEPPIQEP